MKKEKILKKPHGPKKRKPERTTKTYMINNNLLSIIKKIAEEQRESESDVVNYFLENAFNSRGV